MTIVDWMFEHPWMTFFICLAFARSISYIAVALFAPRSGGNNSDT